MEKNNITDKDVIKVLKDKVKGLIEYADSLDLLAKDYQDKAKEQRKKAKAIEETIKEFDDGKTDANRVGVIDSNKVIKTANITFGDVILSILDDGIPKTSPQLMRLYNEGRSDDKKINIFNHFSSRLSLFGRKGKIKIHEISTNPIHSRYLYGKSEWFEDNNLKQEYLIKAVFDK